MIEDLINFIDLYKASMEHKNLDFDADKAAQYSLVREAMAEIYKDDETFLDQSVRSTYKIKTLHAHISNRLECNVSDGKQIEKWLPGESRFLMGRFTTS